MKRVKMIRTEPTEPVTITVVTDTKNWVNRILIGGVDITRHVTTWNMEMRNGPFELNEGTVLTLTLVGCAFARGISDDGQKTAAAPEIIEVLNKSIRKMDFGGDR